MELENALLDLSDRLPALGIPTTLNSHADLEQLIPHIEAAINGVRLWEFYVFDTQSSVRAVASALDSGPITEWKGQPVAGRSAEELSQILKSEGVLQNYRAFSDRYCSTVDPKVAAGIMKSNSLNESTEALASKWGRVLDVLNVDLYRECNEDVAAAKDGIIGRIKYTRLEPHGPKLGAITKS